MAPERLVDIAVFFIVGRPSKESDVYSLAMASFEVCSSVVDHSTT